MALIFLTVISVKWVVFEVFLYTRLLTGPEQFAVSNLSYFMMDLYLMMYCPYMWIKSSTRDRWAGWGRERGSRGKYFYFVRKPDPREELIRQGYFNTTGHFAYLRRKNNTVQNIMEKRIALQCDHSVYVISEPEGGQDVSMNTALDWGEEGDSIFSKE